MTLDWVYQIYLEPTKQFEDYTFVDVLVNMWLGYNIIFNLHIMPVNFAILIKEVLLEIFPPLLDQDRTNNLDLEDAEDVVNPDSYIGLISRG